MSKASVKDKVVAIHPSDAKFGVDMDRRWREQYANDRRKLVAISLSDRLTKLRCEFVREGITDEGEQSPVFSEKTKKPLVYFPDEILALLDKMTKYVIKICEFPDSDIEVINVVGIRLAYADIPGAVPKVSITARKQVLADDYWWTFQTPSVYLRGVEGSSLILPEGAEKIIESLRLHCMRAVDGEFEKPVEQLDLLENSTVEPESAEMFDE